MICNYLTLSWLGVVLLPPLLAAEPARLKVLTGFLPAYSFTINLTRDLADVENLGAGSVGPHELQLAPRDLRRLAAANLIVVNGLGLNNWLPKALAAGAGSNRTTVVELGAGLDEQLIRHATPLTGVSAASAPATEPNPHCWLDPRLASHSVTNILRALTQADPARAASYQRNAREYLDRLDRLDAELRAGLAPLKGRPFVTYHDAFPYFVRRYDLRLVGVIELTPDVEPSPRYLGRLAGIMRETQVRVIFTEAQFSARLPNQLGRDLGLPVAELDTLETGPLTATSYEEGMRRNLQTLRRFLLAP